MPGMRALVWGVALLLFLVRTVLWRLARRRQHRGGTAAVSEAQAMAAPLQSMLRREQVLPVVSE